MRWLYLVLASLVGVAKIWGDAGEWNWFLHGYAWDVALPVLTYFVVQEVFGFEGGWLLALLTLIVNSTGECLQLFLKSQTFDPWDFLAYAAGASIALLLDAITPRRPDAASHSDAAPDD
jgi:hypothetical protein